MGVCSLILGIVAVVCSFFLPGLNWLGAVLGVVGIIFGALGRKNAEKKGVATAGLVLSIIATVLGLITWLACAAVVGGIASSLS